MRLKIFVRWDKSRDDAGGLVEVQAGKFGGELGTTWFPSFTVWTRQCGKSLANMGETTTEERSGAAYAVLSDLIFQSTSEIKNS